MQQFAINNICGYHKTRKRPHDFFCRTAALDELIALLHYFLIRRKAFSQVSETKTSSASTCSVPAVATPL